MGSFSDTNVYAVIGPEGGLCFHRGIPEEMWRECDPHQKSMPTGLTVMEANRWLGSLGMRGFVPDVSAPFLELYPSNPIGRVVASTLSSQHIAELFGNLVLCGLRYFGDSEVSEVGLCEVQQQAIRAAHAAAVAIGHQA